MTDLVKMTELVKPRTRKKETAPRKPGGGRKPKAKGPLSAEIIVPLYPETEAILTSFASSQGRTRQDIIRESLDRWITENLIV
jgi:hypothetical protein